MRRPFVRTWAGPPDRSIVCVHALGGSHAHWNAIAPRLTDIATVHAVDLAGFGSSPIGPLGAGLEASRRDLAWLLADIGPAVVIGSSFGGGVAMIQAVTEPESVRGLVLSGSMLPSSKSTVRAARTELIGRRLRQRAHDLLSAGRAVRDGRLRLSHASVHAHLLRGNAARPDAMDDSVVAASVGASAGRSPRLALRAAMDAGRSSFGMMTDVDRFAAITGAIRCPVLVIHGERDRTVPIEYAVVASRRHPDWRLEVLQDVGHLPHLEAPDAWLAAVRPWLVSTDEARRTD